MQSLNHLESTFIFQAYQDRLQPSPNLKSVRKAKEGKPHQTPKSYPSAPNVRSTLQKHQSTNRLFSITGINSLTRSFGPESEAGQWDTHRSVLSQLIPITLLTAGGWNTRYSFLTHHPNSSRTLHNFLCLCHKTSASHRNRKTYIVDEHAVQVRSTIRLFRHVIRWIKLHKSN
jgi:hypothetical protein